MLWHSEHSKMQVQHSWLSSQQIITLQWQTVLYPRTHYWILHTALQSKQHSHILSTVSASLLLIWMPAL